MINATVAQSNSLDVDSALGFQITMPLLSWILRHVEVCGDAEGGDDPKIGWGGGTSPAHPTVEDGDL